MSTCPQVIIIFLLFVPYLGITEHPTWILSDGKHPNWILSLVRENVYTYTVSVFYHIHYINSDVCRDSLLMSMKYFYPYVVPYFICGLCPRMPFFFPSFFLSLLWIQLLLWLILHRPHFQQAPWLRLVSYVGYLRVSIPLSIFKMLQTWLLVGIS